MGDSMKSVLSLYKAHRKLFVVIIIVIVSGIAAIYAAVKDTLDDQVASVSEPKSATSNHPVLTVALTTPQLAEWPQIIVANGNIIAWQEAVIGAEISGHPLTEVRVNVGDVVKKGQLLAKVASNMVAVELEQSKAMVVETEAMLVEARLNGDRARQVESSGVMSSQQINQYFTAEKTVLARLNAAKAKLQADELRLAQTRIVAPDNGVISARTATVGSPTQPGQELFRLIRGNRLEWRAEITAAELGRIKPNMRASLISPNGTRIQGKVRTIAPTVDIQTRNAIVYVDLPPNNAVRAGMFARGEFEIGTVTALTLPQSAVLMRDGFSYVYRVDSNNRVVQLKVSLGRRVGDRIEITNGLDAKTRVITSGAGFLTDGDVVRVVDTTAPSDVTVK